MRPIMLALSRSPQSPTLARRAVCLARDQASALVVAFVVDRNVERYLEATHVVSAMHLQIITDRRFAFFEECRREGERAVRAIADTASNAGVATTTRVVIGRFGIEIVKMAKQMKPSVILLTRSGRPMWLRRMFGAPVDHIIRHAGVAVLLEDKLAV